MKAIAGPALGLGIALAALAADQFAKAWAHAWVGMHGPISVIPGFNIVASGNTGMAFGIGQGAALWVFVGIALVITAWLLLWLVRAHRAITAIGLGLAIGGALANTIDRLRLGAVRDFIDIYWRDWHWPAFNLADATIVTGLAMVVLFHAETGRRDHLPSETRSDGTS